MEADFLREYRIDLSKEIGDITWRKFLILIRGLSPGSATASRVNSRQEFGRRGEKVNVITTPKAADQAFVASFGHLKKKT